MIVSVPERFKYKPATKGGRGGTVPYTVNTSVHSTTYPLNREDTVTCDRLGHHFEGRCEDCDARRLAAMSKGTAEDRYLSGRIDQDQYEAYCAVWSHLCPVNGWPIGLHDQPVAKRIAGKILHFHAARKGK